MHFTIDGGQVAAAITSANTKFNLTMGTDPSRWQLVHTNVELEGTGQGRAAHALQNMTIAWNTEARPAY